MINIFNTELNVCKLIFFELDNVPKAGVRLHQYNFSTAKENVVRLNHVCLGGLAGIKVRVIELTILKLLSHNL